MRVQLITHSYLPERTPPQRRWAAFVEAFRAEGWDVDVVVPPADPGHVPGAGPSSGEAERAGQAGQDTAAAGASAGAGPWGERIHRTLRWPVLEGTRDGRFLGHILHAVAAIPVGLRAARPDVIVITVPALPTVVAGWTLSRLRRVPLIVEMRDAWPDLARESGVSTGLLSRVMESLVTGTQRTADLVVTVTDGFAERLRERGIERVDVVGNGVPLDAIPAVPSRSRPPGHLNVLYLGNHGESQGLETVIQAAALVRGGPEHIEVRLVGSGTRHSALAELNASLGSPVQMLDPVHGVALQDQYAWADTCLVTLRPDWPSFDWTVPSKTYELLAVGRHVTGIVTGEAARILQDSGAATLVTAQAQALAAQWRLLAQQPGSTDVDGRGREWVGLHADLPQLGRRFVERARDTVLRHAGRGTPYNRH